MRNIMEEEQKTLASQQKIELSAAIHDVDKKIQQVCLFSFASCLLSHIFLFVPSPSLHLPPSPSTGS
jgi:hypothetical protein